MSDLTVEEWNAAMGVVQAMKTEEEKTPPSVKSKKEPTKRRVPVAKSKPSEKAAEDLGTTPDENATMPDGSFLIVTPGNVKQAVEKILSAEQLNPDPVNKPWYVGVKSHIATRAKQLDCLDLVPDSWKAYAQVGDNTGPLNSPPIPPVPPVTEN